MASTGPLAIQLSHNGNIGKLEIGERLAVIFGDSQGSTAVKLGYQIPYQFNAIAWDASISGNRLTQTVVGSHTAGYLRYKHTTPGKGDLCDMRDVMFVSAGIGLNDISALVSTNESQRDYAVSQIGQKMFEIFGDVKLNGNYGLILGLPPYSSSDNTSVE